MLFACGLFSRLRGLLFRRGFAGQILLCPCRSVHTFGMDGCIDIAFADRRGRVLSAVRDVAPGKVLGVRGSYAVLERRSDPALPWYSAGQLLEGFSIGKEGVGR